MYHIQNVEDLLGVNCKDRGSIIVIPLLITYYNKVKATDRFKKGSYSNLSTN